MERNLELAVMSDRVTYRLIGSYRQPVQKNKRTWEADLATAGELVFRAGVGIDRIGNPIQENK